jgi:Family of unknown function (DUF6101)
MRVGGAKPAGSTRVLRLDPLALPLCFEASDAAADGRVRSIELHRERVIVRRAVRGMRMAVNLPISAYLGLAVRLIPPEDDAPGAIAVMLEHRDPTLSLPLYVASDGTEIIAEWQNWARVLGRPLLIVDDDGNVHDPLPRIGALLVGKSAQRRRRRSAIKARRPSIPLRRPLGSLPSPPTVHRGEYEIIARN